MSYVDYLLLVHDMRAMFVRELEALKNHPEEFSRGTIHHISATSVPYYWPVDVKYSLLWAAESLRIDLEPDMTLRYEEAARLAYNIGETQDGNSFLLMYVNYNPSELYLSFAEFSDNTDPEEHPQYPVDCQYTLKALGEASASKYRDTTIYLNQVNRAIDTLLYKHTVMDPYNIAEPSREYLSECPYLDFKPSF